MKIFRFNLGLGLGLSLLLIALGLGPSQAADKVAVPLANIFLPLGFDQNDHVEVVVSGFLPNLCYSNVSSTFKIIPEKKKILVDLKAHFKTPGTGICLDIAVPFLETIEIGKVPPGNYKVVANEKDTTMLKAKAPLKIGLSQSSSIDDHIYAKVNYVAPVEGNPRKVKLMGINPADCLELKEVKFISNGLDTYSVLPIMKQVHQVCNKTNNPFSYEVELPEDLDISQGVLLHVRSMDGKAVNMPLGALF